SSLEGGRPVLFFPDTFVTFHEPALGLAALEVLRRAGCTVEIASSVRCCGRPLISNGLLAEAVVHARRNVAVLYRWAEQGKPIVACEPSCLLTIKDDYPALLRGYWRHQAEIVAAACQTFEEFLESNSERLTLRAGPKQVLVQGHCHQRS